MKKIFRGAIAILLCLSLGFCFLSACKYGKYAGTYKPTDTTSAMRIKLYSSGRFKAGDTTGFDGNLDSVPADGGRLVTGTYEVKDGKITFSSKMETAFGMENVEIVGEFRSNGNIKVQFFGKELVYKKL